MGADDAVIVIIGVVAVLTGVFAGGPKGVSEGEAFGLGGIVEPMVVGTVRPEPAQEERIN